MAEDGKYPIITLNLEGYKLSRRIIIESNFNLYNQGGMDKKLILTNLASTAHIHRLAILFFFHKETFFLKNSSFKKKATSALIPFGVACMTTMNRCVFTLVLAMVKC